jgi:hypothetical protein
MRGPRCFLLMAAALIVSSLLPAQALAYVGPGPGLEVIPCLYALLSVAGMAFSAVLIWPFTAVLRRIRRTSDGPARDAVHHGPPGDAR